MIFKMFSLIFVNLHEIREVTLENFFNLHHLSNRALTINRSNRFISRSFI